MNKIYIIKVSKEVDRGIDQNLFVQLSICRNCSPRFRHIYKRIDVRTFFVLPSPFVHSRVKLRSRLSYRDPSGPGPQVEFSGEMAQRVLIWHMVFNWSTENSHTTTSGPRDTRLPTCSLVSFRVVTTTLLSLTSGWLPPIRRLTAGRSPSSSWECLTCRTSTLYDTCFDMTTTRRRRADEIDSSV